MYAGADGMWSICSSVDKGAVRRSLDDLQGSQIRVPEVSLAHFEKAIGNAKATVGREELLRYQKWTRDYGEEG